MINTTSLASAGPVECSPRKPWGIHLGFTRNSCPRCGWATGAPAILDDRNASLPADRGGFSVWRSAASTG
jgi:hypothetical protein